MIFDAPLVPEEFEKRLEIVNKELKKSPNETVKTIKQ
jgi:hypothetical protein